VIEQILQADRYLQVDQVGRARDVYQRVVEMDPGNAIAVVGLARCALAEGDDARAYELASQALGIDPENDMARRMEARLSEVLASRGEPVARPEAAATPAAREMRTVVTEEPAAPDAATLATADRARSQQPPSSTDRTRPPSSPKERAVRKSIFDRLLGR
jgi:hypothetical protein